MHIDEAIKRVAVVGAAGKMGSGIALLLLQEMAKSEAEKTGNVGSGDYLLMLIDMDQHALQSLKKHLKILLTKYAERNINNLRKYFSENLNLVSNEEIIRAFVDGACDMIRLETNISSAKDATLVFEAIVENVTIKTSVLNEIRNASKNAQYFFTNTSSIPISVLNNNCHLNNRIIGFHFYNPPAVQKLVELISLDNSDPTLSVLASDLADRLQKMTVPSHDIAGFIGNGHFIREILFACNLVRQLKQSEKWPLEKAIFVVNRVTQEFLIRPMGIFQLIDYVGVDVCQNIAKIMSTYLDPAIHDDLIDAMIAAGVKGGQHADGTQKNGFIQYHKHSLIGVYSLEQKRYMSLSDSTFLKESDQFLGDLPEPAVNWKNLQNDSEKKQKMRNFFTVLFNSSTNGANLAKQYLAHSQQIAKNLVKDDVADRIEDVDAVLQNGFFHLYGVGTLQIPDAALRK